MADLISCTTEEVKNSAYAEVKIILHLSGLSGTSSQTIPLVVEQHFFNPSVQEHCVANNTFEQVFTKIMYQQNVHLIMRKCIKYIQPFEPITFFPIY